jgi:hypothetical protein
VGLRRLALLVLPVLLVLVLRLPQSLRRFLLWHLHQALFREQRRAQH